MADFGFTYCVFHQFPESIFEYDLAWIQRTKLVAVPQCIYLQLPADQHILAMFPEERWTDTAYAANLHDDHSWCIHFPGEKWLFLFVICKNLF